MSSMVALGSVLVPRPDHEALWATTVTVPCAAHTGRPVLVMSILATPLRFPSAMMSATATQTPLDTGRRRFSLNSVVATHDPGGITG